MQNVIFSQKITKKSLNGWELCPQTPVCDKVKLHELTYYDSQVRHLHFLTISLSPLPLTKSWSSVNRPQLQIFYSTISLSHQKFLLWKFLLTSLQVICGLPPPFQSKILDLSLCALGPWSLTSSIPVLGPERVCPQEVGPWPWFWNFFESLASNFGSSTPPLLCNLSHQRINSCQPSCQPWQ